MTRSGRSTLLDMGAPAPFRLRPWWRRRVLTAAFMGVVALIALAVGYQVFATDGPGRLLYLLHDLVWVPVWSWLWVRRGFTSLVWWLPLMIGAGLAASEYAGLWQPVRRAQVFILRLGLRGRLQSSFLRFQRWLGLGRGREGLVVAVLNADLTQAASAARQAIEAGTPADPTGLERALIALCLLRPDDAGMQMRAAEELAVIEALQGAAAAAPLRDALRRIWTDPVAEGIFRALDLQPETAAALTADLVAGRMRPERLALTTLGMARGARSLAPSVVRQWFTDWARLSHHTDPARPDLSEAERMIDFEFWAAHAERGLQQSEVTGDRAGWFAALLPEVAMRNPMGEVAAAGTQPTGEAR